MQFYKYNLVVCFLCFFSSCISKPVNKFRAIKEDSTVIKYDSKAKMDFSFYHVDKYTTTVFPLNISYKSDSNSIKFEDEDSIFLIFELKKMVPILLRKGDSILIQRLGTDSFKLSNIEIPSRNFELRFFFEMPQQIQYKAYKLNNLKNQIDAYTIYSQRLNYLERWKNQYSLKSDFINYCTKLFYYDLITDSINIYKANKNITNNEYNDLCQSINDPNGTDNYAYRAMSWTLLEYLSFKEFGTFDTKSAFLIIEKYATGNVNDYLKYRVLDFFMNTNSDEVRNRLVEYNNISGAKKYAEILNQNIKIYAGYKELTTSYDSLITLDYFSNETSFQKILTTNKNKILFIDFWATWCTPCIADIPFTISLSKKYDSTFFKRIFISVDQKAANWKKFIETKNMPISDCFILSQKSMGSFTKIFKTNTVPHYVIFNKDGSMLMNNAYSPHEKSLIKFLDKFIK